MIPELKDFCDAASLCLALGAVTLTLPNIAAILSILWSLWRFGEFVVVKVGQRRARNSDRDQR